MTERFFQGIFDFTDGPQRPRRTGRNMCLDDGLSISATRGVIEVAGAYIDSIRLGRGSAASFPATWLTEKSALCAQHGIDLQTGGPLYEVAVARDKVSEFLTESKKAGFTSVEFSENIISLPRKTTLEHLKMAQDTGLEVYFEFGRKYTNDQPMNPNEAASGLLELLAAGVSGITVERAEIDLVIDRTPEVLLRLAELVGLANLNFEIGPRTPHYVERFFELFDPSEVNLNNVALEPVNALDGIRIIANARRGLDRSVGYKYIRDIWKGTKNYGDHPEDS